MAAYLRAGARGDVVRQVPEMPGVPDDSAVLRAANARLRGLLAERDTEIGLLREQLAVLQSQVADLAAQVKANSRNSSRPPSSDGLAKPAPKSLRGKSGRKPGRPKGQPGAAMQLSDHPDTVVRHWPKRCGACGKSLRRGKVTGVERRQVIDIHDAWAPYDSFDGVAGHALCGAHVLRELTAVAGTGRTWAQQAIDALLAPNEAAEAARQDGKTAIDEDFRTRQENCYRDAAGTGIALNAARSGELQQKRHALAARMSNREDHCLRFARDLRVPFTNNPAEQSIRMCRLCIKISGCMRSMTGAEEFCAIRSYLTTAARHGISALQALTSTFQGNPWTPDTG